MHLTPDMLRACYDFLRATPPFRGWRLPPGEEVKFVVSRSRNVMGLCTCHSNGSYEIMISDVQLEHTSVLVQTMAHEMVHVYQAKQGRRARGGSLPHDIWFRARWATIARHHGFDPRTL